ncbi:hypothetical protein ABZS86_25395 [Streptomyces sp. NPDC005355]|uniref:hypothetical protein n=1 Tax=unclassified Streptomyces TaxID=2593676 RepID=UPI0033B0B258
MPDWMPLWGTTALISIATALLTTIVSGRYVAPLLEVRNRRFQTKMKARETFQADALTVASAAARLLATPPPPEASDTVRAALREEHARWLDQIDQATKALADNIGPLAFAYPTAPFSDLAVRYSGNARMVWISDRDEGAKLTTLLAMTQHCHTCFFDSPWYARQRARSWQELERLLDELETATPGGE